MVKNSFRNAAIVEMEKMKDFEENIAGLKQMKYAELVEELNKDQRAIEQIDKPLILYKSEKEV